MTGPDDGGILDRPISRRRLLKTAGVAGALAATGASRLVANASTVRPATPPPGQSGIEHIVVLCMENRSFDHFLGWVPGADGHQAGLAYPDNHGQLHPTHHLTEWSGCGFNDPDHSYAGGRVQLNGGKLDGFRRGSNDDFALGYYLRQDLPTNSAIVDNFTVCDRWFASILGPTYPNRFYTHAAATDRIDNTMTVSTLPTIWDRLSAAGVPANYYFSDVPFLALWGQKYLPIARPIDTFFAQARSGTLPAFSYLDPFFVGEDQGGSNDDHPHADVRRGQSLLGYVMNNLIRGPLWSKTVLLITYDEWGGFFDHVTPPVLPDATPGHAQAGFRVPGYIISPFAPRRHVEHTAFDHTSILKFVEWRWGLKPLQPRDAAANNPATALDFSRRNPTGPITVPADPGPHYCEGMDQVGGIGMLNSDPFWLELLDSHLMRGWDAVA